MNATSSMIWVKFDRIGYHYYPNAPQDVSYLRDKHRHKFYFQIWIEVFHDDREIEFHQFLKWVTSFYDPVPMLNGSAFMGLKNILELDHKSCEMIIDDLASVISTRYPNRNLKIEVSEDNECGAIKEYIRSTKTADF